MMQMNAIKAAKPAIETTQNGVEARIKTGDVCVRAATADADGTGSHCDDDDGGDGEWSQMSAKLRRRRIRKETLRKRNTGCYDIDFVKFGQTY